MRGHVRELSGSFLPRKGPTQRRRRLLPSRPEEVTRLYIDKLRVERQHVQSQCWRKLRHMQRLVCLHVKPCNQSHSNNNFSQSRERHSSTLIEPAQNMTLLLSRRIE